MRRMKARVMFDMAVMKSEDNVGLRWGCVGGGGSNMQTVDRICSACYKMSDKDNMKQILQGVNV